MKRTAFALTAASLLAGHASADLLITEVVDGNRIAANGDAGVSPDPFLTFVELTNTGGSSISLDGFHFINLNNGATDAGFGSTALTGSLGAGESYYLAYESVDAPTAFGSTYGFEADFYFGGKFINGDDTLLLLDTEYVADSGDLDTNTIVDIYGVIGVDGSGQDWEYQDTYASRNVTSANSTFTLSEWTIGAVNALDGLGAAGHAAATSVVPEPSSLALLGLGGLMIARRRRG